ncbi:MAG: hypothetical protein HQ567_31855 [Candidatus Nealsonbacteria bacterium]|nr:hypothetical protein [Candidatus Nealsonbacteria bacterium]
MCKQALIVIAILSAAGVASARQYAPRVVSPHNADAYSMKTFARFPRWRELSGDALAWEVYKYLVDTRTGVFHMNEVLEGRDVLGEYRTVRDPVKIINVYGYAYCGIFGPMMAGVCEDMGIGPARTLSLPGWNHSTSECFYDGQWHYLDVDVRAVFRRDDGTLASMADAQRDASLWTGRGPLFFPNDPLESTRKTYQQTRVLHFHGFNQSGHTMDFVLRQGESLTRWWTPQGGRWHHADVYHEREWLRKLIEQPPRGPAPNHRHFTVHNYANGRFVYRPNLTARSSDFADGVYDAKNVRPGKEGLTLVAPGTGYAVFEVRSPYVIVPVVGRLETTDDDREASVVTIDADGAAAAISLDNGLTWQQLELPSGKATVDLTRHVSGTYGYLLKLALNRSGDPPVVRSLVIDTWVQVAPAALPSLRQGVNRMDYRTGDHYGLNTRVMEIAPVASDRDDLLKYVVEEPADYDPTQKTGRIRGPLVAKVEAPPQTKIAWFVAAGSFRTHQLEAARKTRNSIAYATGRDEQFREIYRADVPTDTEHWHYNAYREVQLAEPAERLFVRYHGDPALNNVRIYAHCLDDDRRSAGPVRITHAWRENDERKSKTVTLDEPGPYRIIADAEPVDESIEIAVPSNVR